MRIVFAQPVVLRQGRRHICRKFSTSRVVTDAPQSSGLPPARLRALISLYHISSTFITPATLSDRIDLAFTDQTNSNSITAQAKSYSELQTQLYAKRNENKVGSSLRTAFRGVDLTPEGQLWSDQRGRRQTLVSAALWGTESDGKPSLETVLETSGSDEELSFQFRETENNTDESDPGELSVLNLEIKVVE